MNPISFSITRVNRLREVAENAREIPMHDTDPSGEGRAFSATDYANDLLGVFDTLSLKPEFALYAFAYRDFYGGNGRIWAVPADSVPVASDGRPRLEDERMQRPPGAVPLMHAIEGDGSPWSYLSASILSREAAEFGAWWHGCDWSVHTILSKPPQQADDPDVSDDDWQLTGEAPVGNWTWHGPVPHTWEPTFAEIGTTKEVVLHVRNPIGQERIYRATDTYRGGSYDGKTETEVLCSGEGGIVF